MKTTLLSLLVAFALAMGGVSDKATQEQVPEMLARANQLVYQMVKLGEDGQPVPQELAHLYMEKMYKAFGEAAGMKKADQTKTMQQIRTALQTQSQTMTQFRKNFPENADPLMSQVMEMLQAQNRLVSLGTTDPLTFKAVVRQMLSAGMPADKTPSQSVGESKNSANGGGKGSKGGK